MDQDPPPDEVYEVFKQEAQSLEVVEEDHQSPAPVEPPIKRKRDWRQRKRIFLIGGIIIAASLLMLAGMWFFKPKARTTVIINTQTLDNGTLNELTSKSGSQVTQQLTITPDTIFSNSVTVQGNTVINKSLTIHEDLSVEGRTTLQGAVDIGDSLSVAKDLAVNGSTSITGSLTVNGRVVAGSLAIGTVEATTINVGSNLTIGGHLIPTGDEPKVERSVASGGGSVSISGNDTAGTITITTGNGAQHAGEMAIITFKTEFSLTPKVQLTPVNEASARIPYFVSRAARFFTVNTGSAPIAGTIYVFDYLVTQ